MVTESTRRAGNEGGRQAQRGCDEAAGQWMKRRVPGKSTRWLEEGGGVGKMDRCSTEDQRRQGVMQAEKVCPMITSLGQRD